jgi:hypothetical protein
VLIRTVAMLVQLAIAEVRIFGLDPEAVPLALTYDRSGIIRCKNRPTARSGMLRIAEAARQQADWSSTTAVWFAKGKRLRTDWQERAPWISLPIN